VDYTCAPPNSWTGSVSAFIGSSPLTVPGGPVTVSVTGPNNYSASYSFPMKPHEPLSISTPLPRMAGSYTITASYEPYFTPHGTIYYDSSSASTTVNVDVVICR
ncbi:hypothetical protein, partial [Thermocladium modestius]|uniref:hypothetical protein n=1 Tax=Thermocladium modestius TaxID=62609 RepID=UPI00166E2F13